MGADVEKRKKSRMESPWFGRIVVLIASTTTLPLTIALLLETGGEWQKIAIALSPFLVALGGGFLGLGLINLLLRLFDE